jgi:hypothetical protein
VQASSTAFGRSRSTFRRSWKGDSTSGSWFAKEVPDSAAIRWVGDGRTGERATTISTFEELGN